MNSLLITGISGNIGYDIYKYFRKKFIITGLDLTNRYNIENFIECDISLNYELKKKLHNQNFDYVIHAAGIAHNFNSYSDKEIHDSNFIGTKNLVDILNHKSIFIFLSTVGVYGKSILNYKKINEKSKALPLDIYSKSKLMAEGYIKQKIIKYIILRCTPIYSEKLTADLKKRIFYNKFFHLNFGGGIQKHTFCSIKFFLMLLSKLIEFKIENVLFNVCESKLHQSCEISKLIDINSKSLRINLPLKLINSLTFIYLLLIKNEKKDILKLKFHKVLNNNIYESSIFKLNLLKNKS